MAYHSRPPAWSRLSVARWPRRAAAQISEELTKLPAYRYTSLKNASCSVRLLRATSRWSVSCFNCELVEIGIAGKLPDGQDAQDAIPPYTALSYTWGDPEATVGSDVGHGVEVAKALIIDGQVLRIRSNVYDFLSFSNAETTGEWFWIDAVCIDQTNIEERNRQVRLMAQIYSHAVRVRVWLGHGDDGLRWLLRDIVKDPQTSESLYLTQTRELQDSRYRIIARGAFQKLNQLTYWTRMWVVQEIFFAKKVDVHYDKEAIPWEKLYKAWLVRKRLTRYGDDSVTLSSEDDMSSLISIRHDSSILSKRRMSLLLYELHKGNCTLQHDRIYAALALIEFGDQFPVDYNSSLIEVLVEALAFMVRTEDLNPEIIQLTRTIAEGLLNDFYADEEEPIFANVRNGLQQMHGSRKAVSSGSHLKKSQSKSCALPVGYRSDQFGSPWVLSTVATLFLVCEERNLEHFQSICGDDLDLIYAFLHAEAKPTDLFCWNSHLGLLLILRLSFTISSTSGEVAVDQDGNTSTYNVVGRIAFDRSLRKGVERSYYELYTGTNGLPGAQITMQDDNGLARPLLTITNARAEIVLFALPEHQGIRLSAMNLMATCGGNLDFVETQFWVNNKTDNSGYFATKDDIETVAISEEGNNRGGRDQYIRYRPHSALCDSWDAITKVRNSKVGEGVTDQDSKHYYIDFLFENDRIIAEQECADVSNSDT